MHLRLSLALAWTIQLLIGPPAYSRSCHGLPAELNTNERNAACGALTEGI